MFPPEKARHFRSQKPELVFSVIVTRRRWCDEGNKEREEKRNGNGSKQMRDISRVMQEGDWNKMNKRFRRIEKKSLGDDYKVCKPALLSDS